MIEIENINYDDMKPIAVSFKKNKDDLELYKWVLGHSGYSSFIKDILRETMINEVTSKSNTKEEKGYNKNLNSSINQNNLIDF